MDDTLFIWREGTLFVTWGSGGILWFSLPHLLFFSTSLFYKRRSYGRGTFIPQQIDAVTDLVIINLDAIVALQPFLGVNFSQLAPNPVNTEDSVSEFFESCALYKFGEEVRQYGYLAHVDGRFRRFESDPRQKKSLVLMCQVFLN